MYPNFKKVWSKTTKNYIYSIVVESDGEENLTPSFVSLWIHSRINDQGYTYKYAVVFDIREKSYRINSIRYDDFFKFLLAVSKRIKSKAVIDKFVNICSAVLICINS